MKHSTHRNHIIFNLLWKALERIGTQGIQFIVQIVLARLLMPEDYGIIALVTIFIAISNVIVQSGFNTALIQKKNTDEADYSSVFYLNFVVAGGLYAILFFSAPTIADFFNEPQIVHVLRVLSITLFLGAFHSIQNALIARKLQFKRLFYSSLSGVLISGAIGISMAYSGLGVWALVWQQLSNQIVVTFILWSLVKWHPKRIFSLERLSRLFSYGWKLLLSSLINTIYNDIYDLVIGKVYNSAILGFYNRGKQFPNFIVSNINGSIQSVMLPVLSAHQDNIVQVKGMVRRSIVTSSFFIFPAMIGLAASAETLVKMILTEKWLPCVPFLQLLSLSYILMPIHTANLQAINAIGRSDIFLKLEIIKKIIGLLVLVISVPFGIYVMVALQPIVSLISSVINAFPNKKLLGYSYKEQWLDILPSFLLSVVMGGLIYCINFLEFNAALTLTLQIALGGSVYFGMAYLLKLECLRYLMNTTKGIFSRRQGASATSVR